MIRASDYPIGEWGPIQEIGSWGLGTWIVVLVVLAVIRGRRRR